MTSMTCIMQLKACHTLGVAIQTSRVGKINPKRLSSDSPYKLCIQLYEGIIITIHNSDLNLVFTPDVIKD